MAFSLAFSQAPPDHPFVGEYFPVQLTLIDGDHEIHGGIELPLSLELYFDAVDAAARESRFATASFDARPCGHRRAWRSRPCKPLAHIPPGLQGRRVS